MGWEAVELTKVTQGRANLWLLWEQRGAVAVVVFAHT